MRRITRVLKTTGRPQVLKRSEADGIKLTTVIPMRVVRHRSSRVIIRPGFEGQPAGERQWQAEVDANLIKALARAVYWQDLLDTGRVVNITELAKSEGLEKMRIQKTLKMALLHPQIAEQIASGKAPTGLSFEFFVRRPLPFDWADQERVVTELCR